MKTYKNYNNDDLKNEVLSHGKDLINYVLPLAKKKGNMCCHCHSGAGKNGTGVVQVPDKPNDFKCFNCGEYGDILHWTQAAYHCDFKEALKICADFLGLDEQHYNVTPVTPKSNTIQFQNIKSNKDFSADFQQWHNALIETADNEGRKYLHSRALDDIDLINRFNLGFNSQNNCLIIPHGIGFYTARSVSGSNRFNNNPAGSHVALFNAECLTSTDKPVFVTEGAIDALSIIKAGGSAVAVGGVGNIRVLIRTLDNLKINNTLRFIILFDDDKAGRDASTKLQNLLLAKNIKVVNETLPLINGSNNDHSDPNDWLQYDFPTFQQIIQQKMESATAKFTDWTPPLFKDNTSAVQDTETQKAINILQSVTDFSKDIIFSEEVLHAAAICYIYAIKDCENFREKCDRCGIRVALLDSKIKIYAKPIQKEKDYREKQRWNKIKEDEYKQTEQERERQRLDNLERVIQTSNDESVDKEKLIDYIKNSLERDHKGNLLKNTRNFELIINNDPFIKEAAGFNDFNKKTVPLRKLLWHHTFNKNLAWCDSDDSGMQNYIDRTYNIRNDKVFRDVIDEYSKQKTFHPIRDFFNNLPTWDGIVRAETVFIDSLGVEDTEYARSVTKHWLLGGVARIFNPGCKFDYCLVTKGVQGIGKSTILNKLAVNPDWFNDSISDINGKDAMEGLLGSWIIELGEMQATKKAENEAIKSYISRKIDSFRRAYGHRKEDFPRQCIFSATTNSEEFLKDRTGGRRWWILVSEAKAYTFKKRMAKFTKDYILQIWAEMYHIYNEMFKDGFDDRLLDIPEHLKKAATDYQEQYTEGGALVGFITEYLDKKYPPNWESFPKLKRRKWLHGETDIIECANGKERDKICPAEIAYEMLNIDDPGKARSTLVEIAEVIAHLPNWKRLKQKQTTIPEYGRQRIVFERLKNPLAND